MSNRKAIVFGKKLLFLLLGGALIGLAVGTFVASSLGVDSISLLATGVQAAVPRLRPITLGNAIIISHSIALVVILCLGRFKECRIGTYIAVISVALFSDFFINLLCNALSSPAMWVQICLAVLGVLALSSGVGLCIFAGLGASPLDLLPVTISQITNRKLSIIRICADFTYAFLGLVLGGKLGLGVTTFACVCLVGPISAQTLKFCESHVSKWRDS